MRAIRTTALLALLVLVVATGAWADAPGLINYQGRLLDQGVPADGTFTMTFRIYDDPTDVSGGACGSPSDACVWQETQSGIAVGGGVFNVLLGAVNPLTGEIFSDSERWIEIEVAGEVMTPRQRIASAAYALNANGRANPSVVVAAFDSQRKSAADHEADGSDDHVTIQEAIDSLPSTGGEVLLLQGTYFVAGTIDLPADVRLVGQGPGSHIVVDPGWDPPDSPAVPLIDVRGPGATGGPGGPRTSLAFLKITSNGDPGIYGWHGVNGSFHGWVHHNHFVGFRSLFGAIDASGSYRNIISNNLFEDCAVGYNGTDTNVQFGNIVSNNTFTECTVQCIKAAWPWELTIVGNTIKTSQPGADGIRIDGTWGDLGSGEPERGRILIANNMIRIEGPSADGNGIVLGVATPAERLLFGDFEKAMITGNYISVDNGDGLVFYSRNERVLVEGNTFESVADDGTSAAVSAIRVGASYDAARGAASTNLDIVDNNFYGGANGIALELDELGHQGIVFRGNHVYGHGTGVEIVAPGGGTAADGTRITDNIFTGVATPVVDNGTQTVIRNNAGFATESSGTAVILDGRISVIVNHGLGITPELHDISVTPTNSMGNASKFFIDNATSTSFTINTDADPGTATATFVWQIGSNG